MSISTEQLNLTTDIVKNMIERLGLTADVKATDREGDLLLTLDTPDPGRLIGRKGRSIDSLEYLLNRILGHHEQDFPRAVLDVAGYQKQTNTEEDAPKPRPNSREISPDDERDQKLEKLAVDAAKEVKRWGEPKEVGPYNSHDRRIVHLALENIEGIVEENAPNEPDDAKLKKMVIRPAEE